MPTRSCGQGSCVTHIQHNNVLLVSYALDVSLVSQVSHVICHVGHLRHLCPMCHTRWWLLLRLIMDCDVQEPVQL